MDEDVDARRSDCLLADEPERRERLPLIRATVLLIVLLGSGYRFYRLRHHLDFNDENDNAVVGWLLTKGERLYATVFSHHMPVAYAAAQAVATFSPGGRVSHFRVVPWLLYAMVALALARGPLFRGEPWAGLLAATAFLGLACLLGPVFFGQMLLADGVWGAFFALFLVMGAIPLLWGVPIRTADAVIAGAALALAPAAALVAVYPAVSGVALCAGAALVDSRTRRLARPVVAPFVSSALGIVLLLMAWLWRYGSLGGLFEQAVLFNADVYAGFFPERSTTARLLSSTGRDWLELLSQTLCGPDLEVVCALLALGSAGGLVLLAYRPRSCGGARPSGFRLLVAALLPTCVALTRMRGGQTRALPLLITALALAAALLGELWVRGLRHSAGSWGAALFALAAPVAALDPSFRASPSVPAPYPSEAGPAAAFIRAHTREDERIASFDLTPGLYMAARRKPAADSVFYLPWQARWEERYLRAPDTLARLRAVHPRYIFLFPWNVWGCYPWEEYAPGLDRFVKENYRQVAPEDFGGMLWELEPARPFTLVSAEAPTLETVNGLPIGRIPARLSRAGLPPLRFEGSPPSSMLRAPRGRVRLAFRAGESAVVIPASWIPARGGTAGARDRQPGFRWAAVVFPNELRRGVHTVSLRLEMADGTYTESGDLLRILLE